MANNGTWICNLGSDPETVQLGGRDCVKLRVAEKAIGKGAITRWFNAIVGGPDVETAQKLVEGDSIALCGELKLTQYKAKQGKMKGKMVNSEEMPFAKLLRVIKSPTFFASLAAEGESDSAEGEPTADAPAGDAEPDLDQPVPDHLQGL